MKKVILITNIISPYRIPFYNYISRYKNFNFRVIALAEKEKDREWILNKNNIKFNLRVLSGWTFLFRRKRRNVSIHINRNIFKTLRDYDPDIIITSGYNSLAYWQSFFYCKIFKKKYILWNGTTLLSSGNINGIKGILKSIIIRGADKYITYGTKAKTYLEYFGAEKENIYVATNTVDVDYFYKNTLTHRNNENFLKTRKKYPKLLLLCVGQLIVRKGIESILKALNIINNKDIGLMIIGSGPEEKKLLTFCEKNKLKNVFFEGFRQQKELLKYYALADILIMPSLEEVWGLVVNEALASGLFVLSSKQAGSSYDIITKDNGIVFDPNNISDIVEKIKFCENNLDKIRKKRTDISDWAVKNISIEKSGDVFISAIKSLL